VAAGGGQLPVRLSKPQGAITDGGFGSPVARRVFLPVQQGAQVVSPMLQIPGNSRCCHPPAPAEPFAVASAPSAADAIQR